LSSRLSGAGSRRFGVIVLAVALVGCGSGSNAAARTGSAQADSFSLAATKRCLSRARIGVTSVPRSDAQKKAFHDLAQRSAIEASRARTRVDLAFAPSADHAKLLLELLSPARPPYQVTVKENVVVLQRKDANGAQVQKILSCLR
jgi:hypothetical protein